MPSKDHPPQRSREPSASIRPAKGPADPLALRLSQQPCQLRMQSAAGLLGAWPAEP